MVELILQINSLGIRFCQIFWDSKFKGRQISLLFFVIGMVMSGITGNSIIRDLTVSYLFLWSSIGTIYGNLVVPNRFIKAKSGRDMLRDFSRKSFYYGWFLIGMFSASISLMVDNVGILFGIVDVNFYFYIFPYVFYISLLLFSICWFTYHIFSNVFKLVYIEREINFHSMILAFSSILCVYGEILPISFFIAVLTVSFTCVKYIVSYRKYMFEGNKFL